MRKVKNEDEIRRCKDMIINVVAENKAKNVCLVPILWYREIKTWLEKPFSPPPSKLNTCSLFNSSKKLNTNLKYQIDFEVVDKKIWDKLTEAFGETPKIERYFVKHPETKNPCVILEGINLEIDVELPNEVRRIKKMTDPQWKIGPILVQLCIALNIDTQNYKLKDVSGSKTIQDYYTTQEIMKKYPGVLLLKRITRKTPTRSQPEPKEDIDFFFARQREWAEKAAPKVTIPKKEEEEVDIERIFSSKEVFDISTDNSANVSNSNLISGRTSSESFIVPTTKIPKHIGFTNIGNTCYFNAAVQCLTRVQPLNDYIFSDQFAQDINTNNPKGSGGRIAKAYRAFVSEMCTTSSPYLKPSSLRSAIVSKYKRFDNYQQHDSQELLGSLLDGLHEDLNQAHAAKGRLPEVSFKESDDSWTVYSAKNSSQIMRIFHGELINQVVCPLCNKSESVRDPFAFVSLPIPSKIFAVDLAKCFESFSQEETLDKKNTWLCPSCKKQVQAKKSIKIKRCPQILIIHLKRFNQFSASKNSTSVNYEETLNMKDVIPGSTNQKYKLISVIYHFGNIFGGHYTAAALDKMTNQWYYYDDSSVSPIMPAKVISGNAYVLFYQRI